MRYLFRDLPEACDNTLAIAERASVTIEFDNDALPEFPIPESFRGRRTKRAPTDYCATSCYEALTSVTGRTSATK
jgi:DNA polymerase III alpha subunit